VPLQGGGSASGTCNGEECRLVPQGGGKLLLVSLSPWRERTGEGEGMLLYMVTLCVRSVDCFDCMLDAALAMTNKDRLFSPPPTPSCFVRFVNGSPTSLRASNAKVHFVGFPAKSFTKRSYSSRLKQPTGLF